MAVDGGRGENSMRASECAACEDGYICRHAEGCLLDSVAAAAPVRPPERVLTCTRCQSPVVVADIDLTRAGGPYLNPTTYVCGNCLEHGQRPAYGEWPRGF